MADAEAKVASAEEKNDDVKDTVVEGQEGASAGEGAGNGAAGAEKPTEPENGENADEKHDDTTDGAKDDTEEEKPAVGSKRTLEEANEEAPAGKKAKPGPVTLGYCTFEDSKSATKYFRDVLSQYPVDTPLNEYEFKAVAALLREGHSHPRRKIGKGVKAITLKHVTINTSSSTCYFLHRVDGTSDDFSYRKCLANLFGEELPPIQRDSRGYGRGGRRGDGGGRRGGGRRGRGRGRGRN